MQILQVTCTKKEMGVREMNLDGEEDAAFIICLQNQSTKLRLVLGRAHNMCCVLWYPVACRGEGCGVQIINPAHIPTVDGNSMERERRSRFTYQRLRHNIRGWNMCWVNNRKTAIGADTAPIAVLRLFIFKKLLTGYTTYIMTGNSNEAGIALYRKYRPQTFKEVLGQEHIVSVLEGSLKEGNISHAYLFSGSRGTGKTTVARILARELGTSEKDLYEMDAASTRGIDDIRELREGVNVVPFDSEYKIYIIDEVHMLTKEAFNALLKTLEEPPKHALFILATTEFEKLPETIVSRCLSFTFKKPTVSVLKEMVKGVAKKEGFTLEQSAADLAALLADGSFRDAHGILQKIFASSSDKKVSVEEVERITSAPKGALVNDVIFSIQESNVEKGFGAIAKAVESNIDMKVFMKLLLHKVRSIMLLKYAPDMESDISEQFGNEDFTFLKKLSGEKDLKINSQVLVELLEAYSAVGRAYLPQLPLELALMKIIKNQ